jgi:hypothetical protein
MQEWPFIKSALWVYIHLLQLTVSNQCSGHEDKVDKPWRPVPSGRITITQIRRLRWILVAGCLAISFFVGRLVLCASLGVTLYTILYDDLLLRGHLFFRNLCIAAGYLAFEVGALFIMSELPAVLQFWENSQDSSTSFCRTDAG